MKAAPAITVVWKYRRRVVAELQTAEAHRRPHLEAALRGLDYLLRAAIQNAARSHAIRATLTATAF